MTIETCSCENSWYFDKQLYRAIVYRKSHVRQEILKKMQLIIPLRFTYKNYTFEFDYSQYCLGRQSSLVEIGCQGEHDLHHPWQGVDRWKRHWGRRQ